MKEIYLYGASGHGKVIAEIAEMTGVVVKAFIDRDLEKKDILKYPVLHQLPQGSLPALISIGANSTRKTIAENNPQLDFQILIHPNSTVSTSSILGKGSVVMAGVVINAEAKIGKHCIINTNASIEHECVIEDFVHISPNVALAGNVTVGEGTHIGIGACVIQGIKIGKWATIGAGAVIIRDVPDGVTVVGNPGRIIKTSAH